MSQTSSPTPSIAPRSLRVQIDRGGTFADAYATWHDRDGVEQELVVKLLSSDPANYKDAPTEAIRRILEHVTQTKIPRGQILNTELIEYVRLSTTVATNALLERKGERHALAITKGFGDLLSIGNQTRPNIFHLNIRKPSILYSTVVEVNERVTLAGYASDPLAARHSVKFDAAGNVKERMTGPSNPDGHFVGDGPGQVVRGLSGEAVRIIQPLDEAQVRHDLQQLYDEGYRSLAVVFIHSFTFPKHERRVAAIARELGFTQVSVSADLLPMIRAVPRGVSATADAYLTPVLTRYLDGFFSGFDEALRRGGEGNPRVEFMASDGGLLDLSNFSGLKSILSGPAGGVVGYALTSWDKKRKQPVIGLDVGGTSTDVSRFAGRYETVYETTTAGVSIQSPQLDITGGGSRLFWRNGMFVAGPESASAFPGPVAYRRPNGLLAVTDANLVLGRLVVSAFPAIFGPTEDLPLDMDASRRAFEDIAETIRGESDAKLSLDEIVYGFINIANENMARPIRTLTEARGHPPSEHILASFGGAGGQHCCEIAAILGIKTILIHRFSSILSAYGLALADRSFELQEPAAAVWSDASKPQLLSRLGKIEADVRTELDRQGFRGKMAQTELFLNMRFDGTDTAMLAAAPSDGSFDFAKSFKAAYLSEYGFLLQKSIIVDDVLVKGTGKTHDAITHTVFDELETLTPTPAPKSTKSQLTYFAQLGRVDTPIYLLPDLSPGQTVTGPALVIDQTATIVVTPGAKATATSQHLVIAL